ncbi:hypothetical protein NQ315_012255 [Exocentrus adspersus]|uniref:DDE Tnp4 domain-containing protein n=1 Tax=Exocentrus adspersus TaxID=1586481 RepID=A0AAV8VFS3_9CUCU|nr:hypothetical protein NQ315_012255 [Exocentrus adspersus]
MLPIVNEIIRQRERRTQNERLRRERRLLRDRSDPYNLPDDRFIELFRLNKAGTHELEDLIRPHLQRSRYSNSVPGRIKLFAALRFYATGSYQRSIGSHFNFGISQTVVHRSIHEITEIINQHVTPLKIQFPRDRRTINENKQLFMERYDFPGVLGCIDCTHVAIVKPKEEEHNFLNRKGYHSLNVQIICDARMKILNINANFPGASHDSFIWRQSQVRDFLLQQYHNGEMRGTWLLGDAGYPLEPILMVPVQNPGAGGEENFNIGLRQARSVVERCIGLLKMRFRCVLQERTARYDPDLQDKL